MLFERVIARSHEEITDQDILALDYDKELSDENEDEDEDHDFDLEVIGVTKCKKQQLTPGKNVADSEEMRDESNTHGPEKEEDKRQPKQPEHSPYVKLED